MWTMIWIAVGALLLLGILEEVTYFVLNKQLGLSRNWSFKKLKLPIDKVTSLFKRRKEQESHSA
ncbi:hypothetical protein [Bacillus sp. AK031]